MALTLVLGPANSAKAGQVLGACADAADRDAVLVVPTRQDVEWYGRELAARGAVLGGPVVTFRGLVEEIARRTGYRPARVSPLQRDRLLRRALGRAELTVAKRSGRGRGFATAAWGLISELERSLITPEHFDAALREWAAPDPRRRAYAHDLAALYDSYARELRGRVDRELFAWGAVDALGGAPQAWGAAPVFIYGFDDLTEAELYAVETLLRPVGAEVTVSLTWEPERTALAARGEAVDALRPHAERVIELPAVDEHYSRRASGVLHHVERQLFEPGPYERLYPGTAVRLLEAGGERAEAELVAAEVLALLRAGVPAGEIAVVYRSLRRAGALLERVFEDFGIPIAMRREVPFVHTPLGRGLVALARCSLLDGSAADLVTYLRTPGLLSRQEIGDRVEATLRRKAVRTASEAIAVSELRFAEVDVLRHARDPILELGRQATRLFSSHRRGLAPVLDGPEELDGRALAVLMRALAELAELGEQLGPEELMEVLEQLTVPVEQPGSGDAILIAEPLEIRARRFRVVFVCGLQENEFPRLGAPDPFLSDELRRELRTVPGDALRLRPREDALEHERYLFYASVSRASEQIVLSYRSSDEEGNIELPSPFIDDVAELLDEGWRERRRRRLLDEIVWPSEQAPTARERARSMATEGPRRLEPPRYRLGATALGHVRHCRVASAGALESYGECPMRWLVERELQPKELAPTHEALARGAVVHQVLEELLRRLGGRLDEQSRPEAERLAAELLREHAAGVGVGRPQAVRAGLVGAIEADITRYLRSEASSGVPWPADALERRFGFEDEDPGSLPALELGSGVRVRGVIDRIDVEPAGAAGRGAVVRDYKTGGLKPEFQGARWEADLRLQVPLYMVAVRELLGLEPVAGFYQPLGGDDLRPRGVFVDGAPVGSEVVANDARTHEELEATLASATRLAVELALRLRAGDLAPHPDTCSRFGCAHPGICRAA